MKLNDFKKLDEAKLLGNYGSALMKKMGNKMRGSGMGAMSTVDQMTKDNYINDFLGAASSSLNSAIESGLVDPNAKSPAAVIAPSTSDEVAPAKTEPKTPEQIRKEKQAAAAGVAQKQMAANPATKPGQEPVAPKTPEQIRQEKQAAAAQAAQSNMAPMSKLPANQPEVQAANIRQQKQTSATNTAQADMAPYSKVKPAPAVWKSNRNPSAPAKRSPKVAESTYSRLDFIFESIMLEADSDNSISGFMQSFFTKHLDGLDTSSAKAKIKELADLVQQTYSKDSGKSAMMKMANLGYALEHSNGGTGSSTSAPEKQLTPAQAMAQGLDSANTATDTLTSTPKGAKTTSTADASTTPTQASTPTEPQGANVTQPAADPQKEKTVYMQVKGMLDKLDKKGKQRILTTLSKQLGTATAVAPVSTAASSSNNSAFGQMASQLTQPGATDTSKVGTATKSSTSGKTQQTTTGTVHTKNRNNANIKRKTPKVKATPATQATPPTEPVQWKGRKKKSAVAESKRVIKVWGQK